MLCKDDKQLLSKQAVGSKQSCNHVRKILMVLLLTWFSVTAVFYPHPMILKVYHSSNFTNVPFLSSFRQETIATSSPSFPKYYGKEDIIKRLQFRKTHIEQSCEPQNGAHFGCDDDWKQMISSPQHNISVCFVQKAGSTNWQHLIYQLRRGGDEVPDINRHDNFIATESMNCSLKRRILTDENFMRIISVRHPFGRLISAWNDKLNRASNYPIDAYLPGIEEYIEDEEYKDADHVVSFRGFVKYLLSQNMETVDSHFQSVETLCRPCELNFNFVMKIETSLQDSPVILGGLNRTLNEYNLHDASNASLVLVNKHMLKEDTKSLVQYHIDLLQQNVRTYFRTLDRDDIDGLLKIYEKDFQRFGYTFDPETLKIGGFD